MHQKKIDNLVFLEEFFLKRISELEDYMLEKKNKIPEHRWVVYYHTLATNRALLKLVKRDLQDLNLRKKDKDLIQ